MELSERRIGEKNERNQLQAAAQKKQTFDLKFETIM
jgi:hypothetical protein